MTDQLQSILADLKNRLGAIYGPRLSRIMLYGSQARGDAETGSDIDVLVVLQGDVHPYDEINRTGDAVSDLSLEHNTVVSCVFLSESDFVSKNSPFLLNVRREGVAV